MMWLYLIKPFAMEELIVRSKVLSKRRSGQATKFVVADLELDLQSKVVKRANTQIKLSPIGFKLLKCLAHYSPSPVSRDKLMQAVWGDEQPDSNSLKVHMFNLRKAVDGCCENKLIQTMAGQGFT